MYLPLRDPMNCSTQASLSFTISLSLLKLMSFESVMPSNHLMLCCPRLICPQSLPAFRVFSTESALRIRWQSIGASASVVPVSVQDFFLTFLFFSLSLFLLLLLLFFFYFTILYWLCHTSTCILHGCTCWFFFRLLNPLISLFCCICHPSHHSHFSWTVAVAWWQFLFLLLWSLHHPTWTFW